MAHSALPPDARSSPGDVADGAGDIRSRLVVDPEEIRSSPEFAALRARFRRFVFPMAAIFLGWYALYVGLAAFAPDLMATRLGGSTITVGLLLGLGQFLSTFAITMVYRSWADRRLDPAASALRERVEGVAR